MMDSLMKMMKDGGEGMEGMEDMAKMMEQMGGMPGMEGGMPGGMPGMGEGGPEDMDAMIDMLKMGLEGGELNNEEARKELRTAFSSMGMDLDTLVMALEGETDPKTVELVGLLKQVANGSTGPAPSPTPAPSKPSDGLDDLLG